MNLTQPTPMTEPAHADLASPLVVMIEPIEERAFATRLAGEAENLWITQVVTTVAQLRALQTTGVVPTCVGFHASVAQLPDRRPWNPAPFHAELKALGWAHITVLVSGGHDERLEEFTQLAKRNGYEGAVARDGWVAYLRQKVRQADTPAHVDRANLLQRLSQVFSQGSHRGKEGSDNLGDHAQHLGPAVLVLREPQPGQAPQVLTQNESAKSNPWSRHDLRRWAWLRGRLEVFKANHPGEPARAHLLDWDGNKKLPVECRLYELGNGDFWYTRDWRVDRERAIDEVFARIETQRSLAGRFDGLADYLAERWSISRLRLFEVAHLPEGRGQLDAHGRWRVHNGAQDHASANPTAFLVVPRLQSGLGWPTNAQQSKGENKHPGGWWSERFTWEKFAEGAYKKPNDFPAKDAWLQRAKVKPGDLNVLDQKYIYEAMDEPCKASQAVDWGFCKRRLLVLVPDATPKNEKIPTSFNPQSSPLTALLAMDRRYDHLLGEGQKHFSSAEQARFKLLHGGVIGEELDIEVVRSMNHGALAAVRERVGQWLADAQKARAHEWEDCISQAIAATVGQGQGMAALCKLCDALRAAWPMLWQEERVRLDLAEQVHDDTPAPPQLSQLFFVTTVGDRQVSMPAGSGTAWQHYSTQPSWPMVPPFAELLGDDPQPTGNCWVMQDFQKWWSKLPQRSQTFAGAAAKCFARTGSWVAMRLPDAPGVAPVLLVAHFDGGPNQVWQEVLQLLLRTAHHVRAPFLLAWSEQQERSVWAASVAHEMKNMALLALDDAQQNPNTSPLLVERLQQQLNLAEDFLFNLRPDLSPDKSLSTQAQTVDVKSLLDNSLSWWREEQAQTEQPDLQWAEGCDFSGVLLVGAQAWQRVLRVLLHNAFRHGSGGVKVAVTQQNAGVSVNQPALTLVLENRASETAVQLLNQTANPNLVATPSAYVRRHIGLKTARALCQQAGAVLNIQAQLGQVTARLDWPMARQTEAAPQNETHHPAGAT
jgi:hypothetical protein